MLYSISPMSSFLLWKFLYMQLHLIVSHTVSQAGDQPLPSPTIQTTVPLSRLCHHHVYKHFSSYRTLVLSHSSKLIGAPPTHNFQLRACCKHAFSITLFTFNNQPGSTSFTYLQYFPIPPCHSLNLFTSSFHI